MEKDSKKNYEIQNNDIVKTINIYNTKKAPETRCYFSANYIEKIKSIVCIGGTNKNCELIDIVTGYNIQKNNWKKYDESSESFDHKITGHTATVISDKNSERIFVFGGFDESNNYTTHAYFISTLEMTPSQIDFRKNKKGIAEYPPSRAYHTANYDKGTNTFYSTLTPEEKRKKCATYGMLGKHLSEESKLKHSLATKGRKRSEEQKIKNSINKKGTIHMTNGTVDVMIKPEREEEFSQKGFWRGRSKNRKENK